MAEWSFDRAATAGGRFQLVISKRNEFGRSVDVTTFRDAPTQFDSYSSGDPFGDSTAQFTFPAITPFDDFTAPDLNPWLGHYSDVDLYWVPAVDVAAQYAALPVGINALTQLRDVVSPANLLSSGGAITGTNRIKLWEGYIASIDLSGDQSQATMQISCQGALFQLDRYLQKPFFPAQPWPLELLIDDAFKHTRKPNLRTHPLITQFPAGWKLKVPKFATQTLYTPVGTPGSNWSGYTSRQTGSWDHTLTGFIQDQLTVMLTDNRCGVTPGNQWTIVHQHAATGLRGRTPILQVRDRFRAPDFDVWYGSPGVVVSLASDSTQSENIIYGEGTSVDGTTWRGAVIAQDGSRTDYLPLAAGRDVYPPDQDERQVVDGQTIYRPMVSEAYTKYGTGFDQADAVLSAQQTLGRDRDPGWSGTVTISLDPNPTMLRWLIRAGMTMRLKGFAGSGDAGLVLHISAVQISPMQGTVEMTVDTRFRDLLTVEEAQSRTRDPLTPVKMLQVNRTSVMIEDIQAPWDYSAGAGYIPKASQAFYYGKPNATGFPYTDWSRKHPPLIHPSWYVKCNANAPTTHGRWAGPVTILTSERGSVIRSEFYVCDLYGRLLTLPFHVGLYRVNVTADAMPHQGTNYSAWRNNAFTEVDPATGNPNPVGSKNAPDQSVWILWGGRVDGVYNRAGFSPGRESAGDKPTGKLVDEGEWSFDNTHNPNYQLTLLPGKREPISAIQMYAMFYCEYSEPVYFMGRLFRKNLGIN